MKKSIFVWIALAALVLNGCEQPGAESPDPIGTTYPRVQVIEHFTGQSCGYCPLGMDQIYEAYSAAPDNYIWISNHTYGKDDFTIGTSNTIATRLGVSGAPAISINRVKHEGYYEYHPYYTGTYLNLEAKTATSTISLDRKYEAADRQLTINVSGKTAESNLDSLRLTIAVTESGMIAKQNDNYETWKGWKEFRHTHAVRTYVTAALGDVVKLKKRTFSKEYTLTLNEAWVPENCEIVAWITKGDGWTPIINGAKLPVVEGSAGGEDIRHGGIEEYPVADTYPENGQPATDIRFKEAAGTFFPNADIPFIWITASNMDTTIGKYGTYKLFPCAGLIIYPSGETSNAIPAGTYTFKPLAEAQAGDALAGYRDDEEHDLEGSVFYHMLKEQQSYYIYKEWMLVDGSITFSDAGFELTATTKNGSPFHATYTGTIVLAQVNAPQRLQKPNVQNFRRIE